MAYVAPAAAAEQQRGGALGFLRACWAAAWLEYRNLRYYPSNLVLAAAQELTAIGVWYFVGRFLDAAASQSVRQYGANYLAYVVVGVLVNQVCLAALNGPFTTISEAFWDKRLETYRLSIHGIWANVVGRLGWDIVFATVLQGAALAGLLAFGGLTLRAGINVPLAVVASLLLVVANAGLGVAGASLFFLPRGQERAGPDHLGLSLPRDAGQRALCAASDFARLAAVAEWHPAPDVRSGGGAASRAHRGRLGLGAPLGGTRPPGPGGRADRGVRLRPADAGAAPRRTRRGIGVVV